MVKEGVIMGEPEVHEYPKCPVCGSEETLIASLAAQEVDKGINPEAVPHYLRAIQFVMRSSNYSVIIGGRAPAGNVFIDICKGKGCGIVRAIRVEIGEAISMGKSPPGTM